MPRVAALGVTILCCLAPASAAAQTQQSSTATQTSPTGVQRTASGEKTLAGCVAREDGAFVLKTDEGTYEFNTSRDLAPYVGKKVRISGKWNSTGVTTVAPMRATTAATSEPSETKKAAPAPAKSFVGDLHLHITGDVIGDCAQQ